MRKLTRRELLKVSLGTMGALALANLPNWNKPALRVGVLPAHAQTSLPRYDLLFTLAWNKGNTSSSGDPTTAVDIDIAAQEPGGGTKIVGPGGEFVCYYNPDGLSAHLDMDNTWGYGPENIYVPEGAAMAGEYVLGFILKNVELGKYIDPEAYPVTLTFTVKTYVGTAQEHSETFTYVLNGENNYGVPLASAYFPSGEIEVWSQGAAKQKTWK